MIPVQLTLKGIYSYHDSSEQTIDFTALNEAGLFGIFGAVGSGKSTILEAIAFALYGDTERLNVRGDDRYYNMLNLKSKELLIRFDFIASKHLESGSNLYRVETSGTRKKRFDQVNSFTSRRFRWQKEDWQPIEDSTERIIGLNYRNFRRSVIIPQGKFQEFLQLSGSERTQMMKELFHLEKFDLGYRVSNLKSQTLSERQVLEGRMIELGDIENVDIASKEAEVKSLKTEIGEREIELKAVREQELALQQLSKLVIERTGLSEQMDGFKEQSAEMGKREAALQSYRLCHHQFATLLEQRDKEQRALITARSEHDTLTQRINSTQEKIRQLDSQFKEVSKAHKQRDELNRKITDLERIREISKTNRLREEKETEAKTQKSRIQQAQGEHDQLSQQITELDAEIQILREQSTARTSIIESLLWHERFSGLSREISIAEQDLEFLSDRIKLLNSNAMEIATSAGLKLTRSQTPKQLSNRIKKLLNSANEELLSDDKAQRKNAKNKLAELQKAYTNILAISSVIAEINLWEKRVSQRINSTRVELKPYDDQSKSPPDGDAEPSEEQFLKVFDDSAQAQEQLNALEKSVQELSAKRSDVMSRLENMKREETELQGSITQETARAQTLEQQLASLSFSEYAVHTDVQLTSMIRELEQQKEFTSTLFGELQEDQTKREKELAGYIGEKKGAEKNLAGSEKKLKGTNEKITQLVTQSDFEDINTVQEILAWELDAEQEAAEIGSYQDQLKRTDDRMVAVDYEIGGRKYDGSQHQLLQAEIQARQVQVDERQRALGSIESEVKRLKADKKSYEKVKKMLKKADQRLENLATIEKMFRASGFVDYVSTIYLQNLCEIANERFHELTRRQFRLELGKDNNFMVRDFLNGGQLRHIKTLSGGQTFQAALCLALALSDSIHLSGGEKQRFFFLDEGFGTLDRDSLRVVIQTLESLRHENRVVGVISHLEDLQQEIDVALRIENTEESGSVIKHS